MNKTYILTSLAVIACINFNAYAMKKETVDAQLWLEKSESALHIVADNFERIQGVSTFGSCKRYSFDEFFTTNQATNVELASFMTQSAQSNALIKAALVMAKSKGATVNVKFDRELIKNHAVRNTFIASIIYMYPGFFKVCITEASSE